MNGMTDFDISQIFASFYRRKGLIICVSIVVFLLTAYTAAILPNVYRSSSLILVSPQRVPASFVTSTITTDLAERMQSIIQEILSRTQLEKIVREFDLYPSTNSSFLEERIEKLRKAIKVEFRRNNVFQLSFESDNPEKAKQITGRIASLFIEQNLQVREQQAMGTKSFMTAEADRLRKELEEQETVVNQYKAANRFELPDQLDSNLRTVEQLRREIEASNLRLAALQERKGILQKQTVESDILGVDLLGGSFTASAEGGPSNLQVQMRKKELDSLLQRYSSKHPDVVRIKKEIEALETESRAVLPSKTPNKPTGAISSGNPLKQVLQTQISDIDAEIQSLRSQRDHIRAQIATLQSRVDATPIRAIELSKISRGYEITLRKYQDLLAKSLESELSENMEKKQKGEQFQILDPANFPLAPVRPNRPMIILIGLLAGLGAGFGLAFVSDNMDTSFKRSDEINTYVNVPLLATIPALMTRGSVLEQRRSQGLLVLASLGVLVVGVVCLRTFGSIYF
jgi:polysaccharide chain length determinant protein (PEP-CTERM system associated)